jgi:hypothetical protein
LDVEFVVHRLGSFREESPGNHHTQNLPRTTAILLEDD